MNPFKFRLNAAIFEALFINPELQTSQTVECVLRNFLENYRNAVEYTESQEARDVVKAWATIAGLTESKLDDLEYVVSCALAVG